MPLIVPDASPATVTRPGLIISDAAAVTTLSATNITSVAATLLGTVAAGSDDTTWWFEYGLTTAYGRRTPSTVRSAGSGPATVLAVIQGLAGATIYHFRAVAQTFETTAYGDDMVFQTLQPVAVDVADPDDVPTPEHVLYPGRLNPDGSFATVDQDSLDEVRQCVTVLLDTPLGIRPLAPVVGVEDPTFVGVDSDDIVTTLEEQEPRASITATVVAGVEPGEQDVSVKVALASDADVDDLEG